MAIKDFRIWDEVLVIKHYCYPTEHEEKFKGLVTSIRRKYIDVEIRDQQNVKQTLTFQQSADFEARYISTETSEISMFPGEGGYREYNEYKRLSKWLFTNPFIGKNLTLEQLILIEMITKSELSTEQFLAINDILTNKIYPRCYYEDDGYCPYLE